MFINQIIIFGSKKFTYFRLNLNISNSEYNQLPFLVPVELQSWSQQTIFNVVTKRRVQHISKSLVPKSLSILNDSIHFLLNTILFSKLFAIPKHTQNLLRWQQKNTNIQQTTLVINTRLYFCLYVYEVSPIKYFFLMFKQNNEITFTALGQIKGMKNSSSETPAIFIEVCLLCVLTIVKKIIAYKT